MSDRDRREVGLDEDARERIAERPFADDLQTHSFEGIPIRGTGAVERGHLGRVEFDFEIGDPKRGERAHGVLDRGHGTKAGATTSVAHVLGTGLHPDGAEPKGDPLRAGREPNAYRHAGMETEAFDFHGASQGLLRESHGTQDYAGGAVGSMFSMPLGPMPEAIPGGETMSTDAKGPSIRFENVVVAYSELVYGLRGVSLVIDQGEFVFFTGQTGAGKSTILKLLTREVGHTGGRVLFKGRDLGLLKARDIPALRREMGIIPQDFGLLPNKRAWENIAYAMRAVGRTRREVRRIVPEILDRVQIGHRGDAFPSELSGGEQQRVAIGRALINDPSLLLADEPTGNLDPARSIEIIELLAELNARGATVLVATHDMAIVERMGKRIITMEEGRIVSDTAAAAREAPPTMAAVELPLFDAEDPVGAGVGDGEGRDA